MDDATKKDRGAGRTATTCGAIAGLHYSLSPASHFEPNPVFNVAFAVIFIPWAFPRRPASVSILAEA
jgi:hypothetical protein